MVMRLAPTLPPLSPNIQSSSIFDDILLFDGVKSMTLGTLVRRVALNISTIEVDGNSYRPTDGPLKRVSLALVKIKTKRKRTIAQYLMSPADLDVVTGTFPNDESYLGVARDLANSGIQSTDEQKLVHSIHEIKEKFLTAQTLTAPLPGRSVIQPENALWERKYSAWPTDYCCVLRPSEAANLGIIVKPA